MSFFIVIVLVFACVSVYAAGKAAFKKGTLRVGKTVFAVELADTALTRMRGLSGKSPLKPREGMLFIFSTPDRYPFWMQGMKFPLDLIWIENGKVVDIMHNARPMSETGYKLYTPKGPVSRVLEIAAGGVKKFGIKIGDAVQLK